MAHQLVASAAKVAISKAIAQIRKDGNQALQEAWREIMDEMLLQLDKDFRVLAETVPGIEVGLARLQAAKLDSRAFGAAFIEAQRSLSNDRIRMLVSSVAGLARPDIDEDLKARAFRIALSLEPSDVVALRKYVDVNEGVRAKAKTVDPGTVDVIPEFMQNLNALLDGPWHLSYKTLETIGCLVKPSEGAMGHGDRSYFSRHNFVLTQRIPSLTTIADAVLDLLSSYEEVPAVP